MNIDVVRDLYAYTEWANERVLDAVAGLPHEAFTRDLGSSYPSIRDTLVHVLSAEWVWLRRWLGESPAGFPDASALETVEALRARWSGVVAERREFLDTLNAESLGRIIDYRTTKGDPFRAPLIELLLHVVNHTTHHRGQVVTMLRQVGAAGVNTDLVTYHRQVVRATV